MKVELSNPLLSVNDQHDLSKNRATSDPRYYSNFDNPQTLPNVSHIHFATGLIPVLGDDIAHGMRPMHRRYSDSDRTGSISERAQGSQSLAVFLLCSVSVGVGVFILPGIFIFTGIVPGVILLLLYALLALYTQLLALECAQIYKAKSYEQLAFYSLGRLGEFLLAFFMIICLLIANCGHIQIVGQLLHDIVDWFYTGQDTEYGFDWEKMAILYAVMLSLTIPWLFQRSLRALSGVGTLSVMTVLVTVVSLTAICIQKLMNGDGASDAKGNLPVYGFEKLVTKQFWMTDFWRASPAIAFVYTPLMELFPVYTEINNNDIAQTRKSVYISTFICFTAYALVSVVVISTYGTDTLQNSLYNVPAENYWFTSCCFVLVIVITLLYPVINYPMMNAVETILDLFGCCVLKEQMVKNDDMTKYTFHENMENVSLLYALIKPSIWWQYIVYHRRDVLSVFFIFIVIGVDICITDLDNLFGLCGSLGISFVCYIYPCTIWIISKCKWNQLSLLSLKFVFTVMVLLFSTSVMVYGTVVIIKNIT